MAKKYYAWKNADCNGHNPEWIEMTGIEFLQFKRKPENKQRRFIELSGYGAEDDVIVIETTKDEHRVWNREQMATARNQEHLRANYTVVSYDNIINEQNLTANELIADETNLEQDFLEKNEYERLNKVLQSLSDEEKVIIQSMFLDDEPISENELARRLNISQQKLNYRKKKIFEKIKKSFC